MARRSPPEGVPSLFGEPESAPAQRETPLLLLMDGHAMVFRAWFALRREQPLTIRATGEDVHGAYSFTTTFFKMLADHRPTHAAIAFDTPHRTFRDEMYTEYKANRPPIPPELTRNVERVKQVMNAFRVPVLESPGYEADDVLGTIAAWSTQHGVDTLIATGDTDTLQLVSPRVRVLLTTGFGDTRIYDEDAVRERYGGLEPVQQRDVKALTGDTSDNVPGVPGIGQKTAMKLINEFGSAEALVERVDEVTPPRIQGLVREHSEQLLKSKFLVTIATAAPTGFDFDAAAFGGFSRDEVLDVFRELEFSSLVARIPSQPGDQQPAADAPAVEPAVPDTDVRPRVVETPAELAALVERLRGADTLVVEAYAAGTRAMESGLAGLAFAVDESEAFYVPVGHAEGKQLSAQEALDVLLPVLRSKPVSGHNLNFTLTLLSNYGLSPTDVSVAFDTMLAAHLTDRALLLKSLAFNQLNVELQALTDLTGTGRKQITFDAVPVADAAKYAAKAAAVTLQLQRALAGDMERDGLTAYHDEHAMPLVPVLARMQTHGIAIDSSVLAELNEEIAGEIQEEERAAYEAVGHEFKINSPAQLGDLLFKELRAAVRAAGRRRATRPTRQSWRTCATTTQSSAMFCATGN